jgi:hypothetical protein
MWVVDQQQESGVLQGELWERARDYAELEGTPPRPLFEEAVRCTGLGRRNDGYTEEAFEYPDDDLLHGQRCVPLAMLAARAAGFAAVNKAISDNELHHIWARA